MYELYKDGPCGGYVVEVPEVIYKMLPGEIRLTCWTADEGKPEFFLFCGEEIQDAGEEIER